MDAALRALNRFGLGARVGERAGIGDPREWLRAQLRPERTRFTAPGVPDADGVADATRNLLSARRS